MLWPFGVKYRLDEESKTKEEEKKTRLKIISAKNQSNTKGTKEAPKLREHGWSCRHISMKIPLMHSAEWWGSAADTIYIFDKNQ